ncbi:putative quinol monooxygenase [Sphingomonas panacis]|nr:antibiotic biosynthesis monooxygenase [Sphingomonas panacis]
MSDQYALCVLLNIKPEHEEEFARRVSENVTETRKDEGLITFNYHKVVEAPIWILYEIWESKKHSDTHRLKPNVQEFFAQAERILAREPEIYQLEPSD